MYIAKGGVLSGVKGASYTQATQQGTAGGVAAAAAK